MLKFCSNLIGIKTDLVKQGEGGSFGHGLELGTQHIHANLIMVQRGSPFATPHVAAHHQAVGVLTIGIALQQPPKIRQRLAIAALLVVILGQLGQQVK